MNSHIAEYVSPGHPDRLADAIVESIVNLAVWRDHDALVGVECAVHTDHVFIDGRIAAGHICAVSPEGIDKIARDVYREAGYGYIWSPTPEALKVIQNVCLGPLSDDERAIRRLSDDQNVVTGYACNHPETDYLPPAHFVANYIGRRVYAWRRLIEPGKFGPDLKVLVDLSFDAAGAGRARHYRWNRLTLSIQHMAGVFAAEQHERILPVVRGALAELEARGLAGIADLPLEKFVLNGMGDFIVGGPEGDNGLSGKKLAVDFYGPEVPIGGGAICGKDPHKVDVAGAFRARKLARQLLLERGGNAVMVRLGWSPGDSIPAIREADCVDSLGMARPIPSSALQVEDWFSIESAVADQRLATLDRRSCVLSGYFFHSDKKGR